MSGAPDRWRPRLWAVLALVLASVMALPLAGIYFFRIYENQLVQQAEAELIAQSAALAAIYKKEIEARAPPAARKGPTAPDTTGEKHQPVAPRLDLTSDALLPPRPEAQPPSTTPEAAYFAMGAGLAPVIADIQRITLAGFRLLDATGVVIGGREEIGQSLAHIEEVAQALAGSFASALRLRVPRSEAPPLYSISRGTHVRVFVAMPVVVEARVAGVVYASRTPSNIVKQLYEQRGKLILAASVIVLLAALIGLVFYRTISGPVQALIARTNAIARGEKDALGPIPMHGTRELAHLSERFLAMARELNRRSDYIATFAAYVSHELKSPLTAIQGAAELMRDSEMSAEDRTRFLDNIVADTSRLSLLLQRLRELARAENAPLAGTAQLRAVVDALARAFPSFTIATEGEDCVLRITADSLGALLTQLADNARQHGATQLTIAAARQGALARVLVSDNGCGVSPNNRAKIFDSFFTTRRENGGTGMGLAIARALAAAHGGAIDFVDSNAGAAFVITLPAA